MKARLLSAARKRHILSIVLLSLCGPAFAIMPAYTITDVGTINGNTQVYGLGLNNLGYAVGYSYQNNVDQTVVGYVYDNAMHSVGDLGGHDSHAYGLNNLGQVVGESKTATGQWLGFVSDNNGNMTPISPFAWGNTSRAIGINDAGQIVGSAGSFNNNNLRHPFLYSGGTMVDLCSGITVCSGEATSINNNGTVVGQINGNGFIYDSTGNHMSLLTGQTGVLAVSPVTISDNGLIAGDAFFNGLRHAFIYDGGIHDLGSLGTDSMAAGVNIFGQVVGEYQGPSGYRAFFYSQLSGMVDLDTLIPADSGWTLWGGPKINDNGQILVNGSKSGFSHALILTPTAPVPVPAAVWLLSSGLIGVAGFACKRKAA